MLANINKLNRSMEGVIAVSDCLFVLYVEMGERGGGEEADDWDNRLAMSSALWRRCGVSLRM